MGRGANRDGGGLVGGVRTGYTATMSMYNLLAALSGAKIDYVLVSIPVASIDDLIRLKSGTGRSKDVLEIEELRKIKRQLAEEQHGQG